MLDIQMRVSGFFAENEEATRRNLSNELINGEKISRIVQTV
jgi:hypothetical protein